jgi:hypothetical protein
LRFNIRAIVESLAAVFDLEEVRASAHADASPEFLLMLALITFDGYLIFPSDDERNARS